MTGITPIYGIRYPDTATKLKALGSDLALMGGDIERVLETAAIPPVSNPQIIAAPSAGARDTYWGVPATEAERLALQAAGAQTVRTDKSWTEQYFATYDQATNPQGATPAGWYPVAGKLPRARVPIVAGGIGGIGNLRYAFRTGYTGTPAPDATWQIAFDANTGKFTPAILGRYRTRFHLDVYASAATVALFSSTINSTVDATSPSSGSVIDVNGVFDRKLVHIALGGGATMSVDTAADYSTAATTDFIQLWFGGISPYGSWSIAAQGPNGNGLHAGREAYIEVEYAGPPQSN
jgi:hypothetical protein